MISLKMKLKVIMDCGGGKSMIIIVQPSDIPHPIVMISKTKNKMMELVKRHHSLKLIRLIQIEEGLMSEAEKILITWLEGHRCVSSFSIVTITAEAKC